MVVERCTPDTIHVGLQVAYIPRHIAKAYLSTPDILKRDGVEHGFVTTVLHVAFCRFYFRDRSKGMRTTLNSESCEISDLYILPEELCVPQEEVDKFLDDNYPHRRRRRHALGS